MLEIFEIIQTQAISATEHLEQAVVKHFNAETFLYLPFSLFLGSFPCQREIVQNRKNIWGSQLNRNASQCKPAIF